MLDFVTIIDKEVKGVRIIKPKFYVNYRIKDLMRRGGTLYAVWNNEAQTWVTGEHAVQFISDTVDAEMKKLADGYMAAGWNVQVEYMHDSDSKSTDRFWRYVEVQLHLDLYHQLDTRVIFANTKTTREDYASKRLPYALEEGDISCYDKVMSTLYDEDERAKLEWAIGAIVAGDSIRLQKFIVLYGEAGAGKSTILHIIEGLFDGYCSSFDAKALASANNAFSLESLKDNPLVAIQHDGNLSRIEDNTKLNQIVSHEPMEVNTKNKSIYTATFNTFLFMATNNPVKITEAKSGLLRRLIDVTPSGRLLPYEEYNAIIGYDGKKIRGKIRFEYGAIAYHCLKVYEDMGEDYYNRYVPINMMAATNDFFDFMDSCYDYFAKKDYVTLDEAWKRYKEYCEFANAFQSTRRVVRTELMNYFEKFEDRAILDGVRVRSLYSGFRKDKFESHVKKVKEKKNDKNKSKSSIINNVNNNGDLRDRVRNDPERNKSHDSWLQLIFEDSIFDQQFANCPAQLEVDYGKGGQPEKAWARCKTKLSDISTSETHYVKPPKNLIVIDFDICDSEGNKCMDKNLKAAAQWPPTYAEFSKSGAGIHLHYFYDGDPALLDSYYAEKVEIKTFTGNASLRRRLSKCNDISIATIKEGLPLKGAPKRMVNWDGIKNEKQLRKMIFKNLNKEYHADTTSSVDYIKHLLDEAYMSGIGYDVTDMRQDILIFASRSTHQAERCLKTVAEMKFKSEEPGDHGDEDGKRPLVVYDTEIYRPDPASGNEGLFLLCWMYENAANDAVVVMVNPSPEEVEAFLQTYDLVGYNTIEYDSHMLYARSMGKNNSDLYDISRRIIDLKDPDAKFSEARKIGKWDVYEYCKAAGDGKSLKKWEIELGHDHKEMGIKWDEPAPKELWPEIIEYCKNDVLATRAVYRATKGYRMAKQFQVDLVKALHPDISVTTIDTANTLSKRIIFGRDRNPQKRFNYRNLALPVGSDQYEEYRRRFGSDYKFRVWNDEGLPEYRDYIPGEELPKGWSILPYFPGYEFDIHAKKDEKSTFHGDHGGEGGRTYSVPGFYINVWDGDISSQYPSTIIAEVLFGYEYTKIFEEIVKARVAVKHKNFEEAGRYLGGALKPYLSEESAKDLAQALKIIVNAVYGLTTASFNNEFKDPRNIDNLVAKRGNLFMLVLKEQIEKRGFKVCHIKTDSIKIPNATQEIKDFVVKFGKEYGYSFETEGEFAKFVLLDKAKYAAYDRKEGWVTRGTELIEPYTKKTLFTKEPIVFDDMCQTFSVQQGAIYLDMNEGLEDVSAELNEAIKTVNREKRSIVRYLNKLSSQIPVDDVDMAQMAFDLGDYELMSECLMDYSSMPDVNKIFVLEQDVKQLNEKIEMLKEKEVASHDLKFVGRVGRFCPIKPGYGGGILYRVQDGKNYAVAKTTGFRWLESENVKAYGKEDAIDISYFNGLVDDVAKSIGQYVDLEWFLSDALPEPEKDIPEFMNLPETEEEILPFD